MCIMQTWRNVAAPYSLQEKKKKKKWAVSRLHSLLFCVKEKREEKKVENSGENKKHVSSARNRFFSDDLELQVAGLFIRPAAAE